VRQLVWAPSSDQNNIRASAKVAGGSETIPAPAISSQIEKQRGGLSNARASLLVSFPPRTPLRFVPDYILGTSMPSAVASAIA
jgi:hypothetical protein